MERKEEEWRVKIRFWKMYSMLGGLPVRHDNTCSKFEFDDFQDYKEHLEKKEKENKQDER